MASSVEICNLALSHLGVGKEIANLETENSEEASACRRFYEPTIRKTLQDFPWPFATRFVDLALVEEDPTDEWDYSYRYPSDCLKIRRIMSGARQDSMASRIAYRIASDATGRIILTDEPEASIEYTVEPPDTSMFDDLFVEAVSYYLAFQIAPRVTGGDPFKLGDRAGQMYSATMARAQASALREDVGDVPLEAAHIRGRE